VKYLIGGLIGAAIIAALGYGVYVWFCIAIIKGFGF
jgi:hypothetical protein